MIKWDGGEYDFDLDKVGSPELREIKRKFGLSLRKLLEGLEDLDIDAVTCIYWLVLRSDGKHDDLVLSDELVFPVVEFMAAWAEGQEEVEPDPTPAGFPLDIATLPSSGSSMATSGKSAASTSRRSAVSST